VEEFVEGTEVTAAVFGEGRAARVLPLLEIVPHSAGGFYDYEAKYTPGGSQHLTPPRLPADVLDRVTDYALRAHRTLGCRGVARSDYIVTADGTPYFLELNTLPGMTEMSLVPDAARAAGIEFSRLIETLILEAMSR
jgi:D-alanine-D-alanine ligase